jgi:glutamate N-acetyltransferase/amino-acid N-acetyltransferase
MAKGSLPVSPLAPASFPRLQPIAGVRMATAAAGVRYQGRTDVLLAAFDEGTQVAGVLTRSKTRSAPVDWCRNGLDAGATARGLVVNSGNANAFTGRAGAAAAETTAKAAARALNVDPQAVYLASTGVIGEVLPAERLVAAMDGLRAALSPDDWEAAARAIMTTDTFPKGATATATIDGVTVTINGIAKGSGMIAPDMATMLCFVATDARVPKAVLQSLLGPAADRSFNAITVDGDTSTSDTVLVFATGAAGNAEITDARDPRLKGFAAALEAVLVDLALQVVRDGEGATKLITIDVTGAASLGAARRIGLAIANSPLVKTAIAGGDANWGRIVMAVGKSGERADRDRIAIWMGGKPVAAAGAVHPDYDEAAATAHVRGTDIVIRVDVGVGKSKARVWTCDLTHGYIDINADYRS